MKVFEISLLVYLLEDIKLETSYSEIGNFIDSCMVKYSDLRTFHNTNTYKNYSFCSFYPLEKDKTYKAGANYTIKIRTVDYLLANFFNEQLVNHYNKNMKALTSNIKILTKRNIEKIYSITPSIIKTDNGYWKGRLPITEYERRLKENLIKKYNLLNNTKINEDFNLYNVIKFKNKKPISFNYKEKNILGDKLEIYINSSKIAQKLAYMSLGTGILEMNARGAGYVNAIFI